MRWTQLIPALVLVTLTGRLPAQDAAPPRVTAARLDALLEPIRRQHDLPALAAAVVTSKGLVAAVAVGVRKRGGDVRVTPHDRFHLGSDTKAMTATLIGRLVEQGELRWDDTLGRHFPQLASPELRRVTLEQLLTHHAGLPANLKDGWGRVPHDLPVREQRQRALEWTAEGRLEGEPGKKFEYSNLGYVIAGHLAERAGNASWEELMAARLFRPLGMGSAGFGAAGRPGAVEQPWPHTRDGKPVEPGPHADNPSVMGPAGRVHCSLPDWARFVADHLRGARGEPGLLRAETYRKLHATPYPDRFYTVGGWGGRARGPRAGGPVLAHDGSNTLNHASAWLAPARDFAVLVATNQGGEPAGKACHAAEDAIIREFLKNP